jgi:uncharacterized protein YecE (DUF72 family)
MATDAHRLVGTSGWMYRDWAGTVYPKGVPQRRWLEAYAERFPTVEINNSFYRLPTREQFAAWRERTPSGFVFAPKVSRYLSHIKRLRDPAEPVARFVDHAAGLGDRLGPSLLQLPPTLRADRGLLTDVLDVWPAGWRLAIEFRHDSWFADPYLDALHERDIALVLADRANHRPEPQVATAGWGYVRLHEGTASPWPSYGERALRHWDQTIDGLWSGDADVYVYFNNDPGGAAVRNAARFTALGASRSAPV